MVRINFTVSDEVDSRLTQLARELGGKSAVLLAALAQYRLDVKPEKQRATVKPKAKPSAIGEGNRPKNIKEVEEHFRHRGVPAPIEQKARLFYDHYEANGWKQGSSTLKNWGACLTTWQKNNADWRSMPQSVEEAPDLGEFLEWVKEHRSSWYGKLRDAKNISEIDEYYIEEYRHNTRF